MPTTLVLGSMLIVKTPVSGLGLCQDAEPTSTPSRYTFIIWSQNDVSLYCRPVKEQHAGYACLTIEHQVVPHGFSSHACNYIYIYRRIWILVNSRISGWIIYVIVLFFIRTFSYRYSNQQEKNASQHCYRLKIEDVADAHAPTRPTFLLFCPFEAYWGLRYFICYIMDGVPSI